MKEQLYQLFQGSIAGVSMDDLVLRVAISVVLGLVIFVSYWISHAGTIYSQKFNINLITLTVLTATVMTVIGNNIALSLGMVGALSIVRFRTAIKDARDTTYIFWAIICGICCGVGQFMAAGIGSVAVFVVLLILGRVRNDTRTLIVIRAARTQELPVEGLVFEYFKGRAVQRVKNTTEDAVEFMFELSRGMLDRAQKKAERPITDELYALGGIDYVNIVAQNDEIGS
ncbi:MULTISPECIES: DUF4956 domain-containing protein [Gordonibacter]|uniref:DUF4956 domain-containing protein n=1 Tax=Gordonibacter faecis TaxID=3047475 RepID=A0ABT7DP32_9ACTN|nr:MULTISPECIES: DUF4956 domain-containing protein [unclassified Gordonibacter]MDJ1651308.1 DUF4956 domain-containing protein [Gordonibacter sp. KGMB12511]HIW76287.1 DUF4956 domain-containing protein [Candidatus Gordonibacter avicola]